MNSDEKKLLEIIRQKALMRGDFTLASGKKSNYYINVKKILLDPQGCMLAGKIILNMLDSETTAVGGVPLGAIPIVSSILVNAFFEGKEIKGFFIRKEKKGYGTDSLIEGDLESKENISLVEDVVTTGGSVLKAIEETRKNELNVIEVITIVDRSKGEANKIFEKENIKFKSIFKIEDILDE